MHRIDGPDHVGNLFSDGPPGTVVTDDWANDVQENLCNFIEDAPSSIALVKGNFTQLIAAFNARVRAIVDGIFVPAPATAGRHGVESTGNGSGAGGSFTGGSSGNGVIGQGQGIGSGVLGQGGGGGGAGVTGVGLINAPAVVGQGDSVQAGVVGTGGALGRGGQFTGGSSSGGGVKATATGSASTAYAVEAIGNGSAPVIRTSGASNQAALRVTDGSYAVLGDGLSQGVDVQSTGDALRGNCTSSGYAARLTGNATHGALMLTPRSSAPSNPQEGALFYDSTQHKLYVATNTGWYEVTLGAAHP